MKHDAALLEMVRSQFRLDWQGIHGAPHWARVRYHGIALAGELGLPAAVPALFAIHDSQRRDDHVDPEHGMRAANYADWLWRKGWIELDSGSMQLLREACEGHSEGHVDAHPLVQACWDADRLDLGRVGIRPDPRRLCTEPARRPEWIERAWNWSRRDSLSLPSHRMRRISIKLPP